MNHVSQKNGFTLVELMLAMGFVSVLLIAVLLTIIQIGGIYNRGLTLKEVNQAGRSLSSEIQRSISTSMPFDLDESHYVSQPDGGRLCLGNYSYIWNYGQAISGGDMNKLNRYDDGDKRNEIIYLVKAYDPGLHYCLDVESRVSSTGTVELVNTGEYSLALHDFQISSDPTTYDARSNQRLYSVSVVVGTNEQEALVYNPNAESTCKPPAEASGMYCAVNRFNVLIRAGNVVR
jgi:type II secretory pathway pseudopilin PulG